MRRLCACCLTVSLLCGAKAPPSRPAPSPAGLWRVEQDHGGKRVFLVELRADGSAVFCQDGAPPLAARWSLENGWFEVWGGAPGRPLTALVQARCMDHWPPRHCFQKWERLKR